MDKNLRALELDKILEMLAAETTCDDAAELALAITPETNLEEVRHLLKQTDDAYVLMAKFGAPSFYGLKNTVNALRRAQAGGALNLVEFLAIDNTLRVIRGVSEWRSKSAGVKTELDYYFETLQPNKFLEERIRMTVKSEEEVADTASTPTAEQRLAALEAAITEGLTRYEEDNGNE